MPWLSSVVVIDSNGWGTQMDAGSRPGGLIAAALRSARSAADMTQEELAHRSGLSVRCIRNLEAGGVGRPRGATLRLMVDALGRHGHVVRQALVRSGRAATESTHPAAGPVPAQLPGDVPAFVGREDALAALDEILVPIDRPTAAVVIAAVSGTAGVGKTALAVHWAHHARDCFPDGQLYVDLRGYDPVEPLAAGEALAGFLVSLGMPAPHVPREIETGAATYRSVIDGKAMLVVLDNAASAEQIRPLLPGSPSVRVLVTSRDSLAGLVARDGARRIDLDALPVRDAIALLCALIGSRAEEDPEAAAALAGWCARLPLALRIAAEVAQRQPQTPLHSLVERLVSETALSGTGLADADRALDELARANLVQCTACGRYEMHPLWGYAARLANSCGTPEEEERDPALIGLLDHFVASTSAAVESQAAMQDR
jgi:Helix-turn-helix domain